jgi:nicotinic acid mononucleotide adenylyltransferase
MVIGDDCFLSLHTWINAKQLVSENRFLVITRNHTKKVLEDYLKKQEILSNYVDNFNIVELFDDEIRNISSSSYRVNNNQNVISKDVINYINNNKLYEV